MYNLKSKDSHFPIYELSKAVSGLMNVRWLFFPLRLVVWTVSAIFPYRSMITGDTTSTSTVPLFFGQTFLTNGAILFGLGTLLYAVISTTKYFQFISKLKSAGNHLNSDGLRAAAKYQESRMWAYGISVFFGLILGVRTIRAVAGYSQYVYSNYYSLEGQSIDYITEYTAHVFQEMITPGNIFNLIVIMVCVLALGITQVMTMFKLNSWALNERIEHPSESTYKEIVEGTNILKIACLIESIAGPLGYIIVNIGLKHTANGILSLYNAKTPRKKARPTRTAYKPITSKPNPRTLKPQTPFRFCSECGSEVNPNYAGKFCWYCGFLMDPDK